MSDHDLGVSTPSTAYLDLIEAESVRKAARSQPIDSAFAGAGEAAAKALATHIDEAADDLRNVVHTLHEDPETAFRETKAAHVLARTLESHGIEATVGVHGLDTAVRAEVTSLDFAPTRHRTVAILGEYDALPDAGHGSGHNVIAATAVGATIALFEWSGVGSGLAVAGADGLKSIGLPACR